MNVRTWNILVSVLILTSAAGCSDRDVDDYQHDRVAEERAQIRSVAGTYRGPVEIPGAGDVFLELELAEDTQVISSRDGTATMPQAALQGRARLWKEGSLRVLSFRGGFFDYRSGDFKAEVSVAQPNAERLAIEISGNVHDGVAQGHIAAITFMELAGSFRLQKDGQLPESARFGYGATNPAPVLSRKFRGMANFANRESLQLDLFVMNAATTTEQDFFDVFAPVKWVDVTLVTPPPASLATNFQNAVLDARSGTLTARRAADSLFLSCRAQGVAWDCSYYRRGNPWFQTVFQPVE